MAEQKIIVGDARIKLKEIESNSVQLIISSPPYCVGKNYEVISDEMPLDEYFEIIENVTKECYRICCDGGRIAYNIPVFGNNAKIKKQEKYVFYLDKYIAILEKAGFSLREVITWVKTYNDFDENTFCHGNTAWGSWQSPSSPYCRSFTEFIVVAHKNSPRLDARGHNSDITKKEFLKWTRNVWFMPAKTDREHPAVFPVDLPYRLIKLYTYVNDTVLDPFCGIGTTLLACRMLNRNGIGIEINPRYAKVAEQRAHLLDKDITKY